MATDTETSIRLITYSPTTLNDSAGSDVDEILSKAQWEEYTWIHVVNLHDLAELTKILGHFGLPLSLAARINDLGPSDLEDDSESYLFKKFLFLEQAGPAAVTPDRRASGILIRPSETDRFKETGGTFILGEKFSLLFEDDGASRLMEDATARILNRKKALKQLGVDFVLYWLVKTILIENYLLIFGQLMDQLKAVEDALLDGATDADVYKDVIRIRREMNPFERSVLYAGEFARAISRQEPVVISQASINQFADNLVNDSNRLQTEFSILRDRTSQLMQMYQDNVNSQLNNVMRVLTVISTIFLPLSFITGFYGMNFPNMPAFSWTGSFPLVVAIMINVPHFTGKAKIDRVVKEAGFANHTFVIAPFYYGNLSGMMAPQKQADGSVGWTLPLDPTVRVIHMGDIAELGYIVAGAFAHPDEAGNGQHLPLVGDFMSFNEIVETLNRQGHNLSYKQVPRESFAGSFPGATEIAETFSYWEAHTYLGSDSSDQIALANRIAGRQPTRFSTWARENFPK